MQHDKEIRMDHWNRREWLTHWGMQGLAATALLDLWRGDGK